MPHYEDAIDYSTDEDMDVLGGGRCRKDEKRVSFCASKVRKSRAGKGKKQSGSKSPAKKSPARKRSGAKSPARKPSGAKKELPDALKFWRASVMEAAKRLKMAKYPAAPKKGTKLYKTARQIYDKL